MQLRPQIANFELSSEKPSGVTHNLDISLFERLCAGGPSFREIVNKLPTTQLTVQRRMRPEIADLIRGPLYPQLLDHGGVTMYPDVKGIRPHVYWFDHSHWEDREETKDMQETSHSNTYEVDMTIQLVKHLLKQGYYKSGEIAIITPYLGQLRKFHHSLKSHFSVEISDRDEDDLANLEATMGAESPEPLRVERKALSDSIRLATVERYCVFFLIVP